MKYASFGSISTGTLRTEDLLEAFASELEYQVKRNAEAWCSDQGRTDRDYYIKLVWDARELDDNECEDADELINNLIEALERFAPDYAYFGALEGDGADFGYWPSMDAIEGLPKVSDPSEVEGMGEDCVFVNDHGNVTVYASDGSVIWDCV